MFFGYNGVNQKVININAKNKEETLNEIRRYLDEDLCD